MREVFIDNVLSSEGLSLLVKQARRNKQFRVAVLSSESCKDILAKFVLKNSGFFLKQHVIATSGTATYIRSHLDIRIESVGHGPDGGDVIIAYKILQREIDLLIFFRGTQETFAHEEDMRMLTRMANMSNCIFATNIATASLIVLALDALMSSAASQGENAPP